MTFSDLLDAIRGRWKVAAFIVCSVVLAALAFSLLLPKAYTATATVVVDVKPDPLTGIVAGAGSAIMATQSDIIANERVARNVVRRLGLDKSPQAIQSWREDSKGVGTVEAWLTGILIQKLSVKPGKESNVLAINYTAADPHFAATVANAFVDAYIETAVELRVQPAKQYSSFFDRQAQEARSSLEAAQKKLSDFKKINGIVGDDERLDVETARLNDLNAQVVALQAAATESNNRNVFAVGASEKMAEALANPVVASLKVELGKSEASLQEMGTRLGSNHPQVMQLKAQIAELKVKVEQETRRVAGSIGVNATVNQNRLAEARAALEMQRQKVLRLKGVRDGMSVLQRDVDNLQKTYDAILGRQALSALESQSQQANVSLLSYASPPLAASFPRVGLYVAVAFMLSLLVAVTIVALMEVLDRRLRKPEQVLEMLGVPVISVVPSATTSATKNRFPFKRITSLPSQATNLKLPKYGS